MMQGSALTREQLDRAEEFMMLAGGPRVDMLVFDIRREDLIRLLAWYGAIRANGAQPRKLQIVNSPTPQPTNPGEESATTK